MVGSDLLRIHIYNDVHDKQKQNKTDDHHHEDNAIMCIQSNGLFLFVTSHSSVPGFKSTKNECASIIELLQRTSPSVRIIVVVLNRLTQTWRSSTENNIPSIRSSMVTLHLI